MFKLAVNRLWIGEYSGISAVALKEHWFWRSGSLAKVSQKQSFPLKFWWGQSQDEAGEKVCVSSVRFVVCIVVLVWITFLKDSSWIFRENSPCEFNSKLGNRALIPLQFSRSVVSDSLRPHESQHVRVPCPSPSPGVHSDSRRLSRWCHPAISSSIVPSSSCPQSLPASESFPVSQLFAWGGQSTGVSASASFLPKNTQGWSPLEWTGWISLQAKGLSWVFSNTTVQKHQFFSAQLSSQSIHTRPLEKP